MGATGGSGYLGPSFIGPNGNPHVAAGGATAVMGIAANSMAPTIDRDSGYHEQHSDALRLPTSGHSTPQTLIVGGWHNPATRSVLGAKPAASVQQATPAIPDVVAVFPIVVLLCIAAGFWITRYLVRPIVAQGFAS
jgi:hypothetical protein